MYPILKKPNLQIMGVLTFISIILVFSLFADFNPEAQNKVTSSSIEVANIETDINTIPLSLGNNIPILVFIVIGLFVFIKIVSNKN